MPLSKSNKRKNLATHLIQESDSPFKTGWKKGPYRSLMETAISQWRYPEDDAHQKETLYADLMLRTKEKRELGIVWEVVLLAMLSGLISAVVKHLVDWWWENRVVRTPILLELSDVDN